MIPIEYHFVWFYTRIWKLKFRIIYVLFLLTLTALAFMLFDFVSFYIGFAEHIITIGAMLAGMLAIIFGIRTVAVQQAASAQSAGLFEIVARDKLNNFVYWYLAICSLLFIFIGLLLNNSIELSSFVSLELIVSLCILATGGSFFLIYLAISRLYDRVNPLKSIDIVKDDFLKRIRKIDKQAQTLSRKLQVASGQEGIEARNNAIAAAYLYYQPDFHRVFEGLTFLFDYHDKLGKDMENTAARRVLLTIGLTVSNYLQMRKDSFHFVSTDNALVYQSDSQKLFGTILERFVARAKFYIAKDDDEGATTIIAILEQLTVNACQVTFVGNHYE